MKQVKKTENKNLKYKTTNTIMQERNEIRKINVKNWLTITLKIVFPNSIVISDCFNKLKLGKKIGFHFECIFIPLEEEFEKIINNSDRKENLINLVEELKESNLKYNFSIESKEHYIQTIEILKNEILNEFKEISNARKKNLFVDLNETIKQIANEFGILLLKTDFLEFIDGTTKQNKFNKIDNFFQSRIIDLLWYKGFDFEFGLNYKSTCNNISVKSVTIPDVWKNRVNEYCYHCDNKYEIIPLYWN